MQFHFHPVTDAAVFPLEGGDQCLLWELEAKWKFVPTRRKDSYLTVICKGEDKKHLIHCIVSFVVIPGPQGSKCDTNGY